MPIVFISASLKNQRGIVGETNKKEQPYQGEHESKIIRSQIAHYFDLDKRSKSYKYDSYGNQHYVRRQRVTEATVVIIHREISFCGNSRQKGKQTRI